MMRERIQQESVSAREFWDGIDPLRRPADLYETMRLYDARTDQIIVLEEKHNRFWTFTIDPHDGETYSQPTYMFCRMLEVR